VNRWYPYMIFAMVAAGAWFVGRWCFGLTIMLIGAFFLFAWSENNKNREQNSLQGSEEQKS
jgi:hypothetical protein